MANGKMTCDCLNYKTKFLCSHVLAVAEKFTALVDLMEWYTRINQGPNLWSLARSFDSPKQPGAKPGGNGRKRSCLSHPKEVTFSTLTENSPHRAEVAQAANSLWIATDD